MRKIGLATSKEIPDLEPNEMELIPLLAQHGIIANPVIWDDPKTDFFVYDCIIIRSCWDYHLNSDAFISWLTLLSKNDIKVFNPPKQILNNINKLYLQTLSEAGVNVVPTIWVTNPNATQIRQLMREHNWQSAVLKPTISASAFETYAFDQNHNLEFVNDLKSSKFMLQPFLKEIKEVGEYSLIFFNKEFSHAVLKKPGAGDFRVQKELGGSVIPITISQATIDCAQNILSHLPDPILYARVDGILHNDEFQLIELELIEPELYLNSPETITAFVNAIIQQVK